MYAYLAKIEVNIFSSMHGGVTDFLFCSGRSFPFGKTSTQNRKRKKRVSLRCDRFIYDT